MPSVGQTVALVALSLLLVTAGIGPVAGSTASGTAPASCVPSSPAPVPANHTAAPTPVETNDTTVARGDVAALPLSVSPGGDTTVSIGRNETARLSLADDGDGTATLYLNTYYLGNRSATPRPVYWARGDDTVTVLDENTTGPGALGTLLVTVRRNGTVLDETRLTVRAASVRNVTLQRGLPQTFDATATELHEYDRSGVIRPLRTAADGDRELVSGEVLVVHLDAPSLLGLLAGRAGATPTERFRALDPFEGVSTRIDFDIQGPCGGIRFYERLRRGDVRVVPDYRHGSVFVLLDTASFGLAYRNSPRLSVSPDGPLSGAQSPPSPEFYVTRQHLQVPAESDGVIPLRAGTVSINGTTALPEGARVPVRIESRLDPTATWRTTATVGPNGSFDATFDLNDANDPGVFQVTVHSTQYAGTIGDTPPMYWEHEMFVPGEEYVFLDDVSLPADGYLVAYRYESDTDRYRVIETIGVGPNQVPGIDGRTFSFTGSDSPRAALLVAHHDGVTDGLYGGLPVGEPYRVDGRPVQEWVTLSDDAPASPPAPFTLDRAVGRDGETPTPGTPSTETPSTETPTTETPVDTATTPDTPSVTTTPTASPSPSVGVRRGATPSPTTAADGPGFGGLASVVAVLAAVVLARRR